MGYAISRYLNVIDLGDTALLFNGVNGCLDEVSGELAEAFKAGEAARLDACDPAQLAALRERGHITSQSPDEELARFKEYAAALHKSQAQNARGGSVMLLMSYNCNLACKYCYQQEHRPHKSKPVMSEELVRKVFEEHLSELVPGADKKSVGITFYGGEPFLPSNEAVVRKALGYAKLYGMPSSAISNATMVDRMPDIFGEGPGLVNRVQVSLDGGRTPHDASRVGPSGEPTYDRILDNVAMLLGRKTRVALRLNLDRRKLESVPGLVKDLKDKGILGHPCLTVYAGPLHDNIAKVDATGFMDVAALSDQVLDLGIDIEHPVSLRANEMSRLFRMKKGLALHRTSFCMQTLQRTLVVDPFGDLYACFEEAGYPEFRVGRISESGVEFFPLHERYKDRHIANMEDCLRCPVALVCGGQCGVRSRTETGDLLKPHCDEMPRVILEAVKSAYQRRDREAVAA